jgi:hypothetical protein
MARTIPGLQSSTAAAIATLGSRLPMDLRLRGPAFIVGCARSGTSVLRRVLARQADIGAFPGEANELWHPRYYPWTSSDHGASPLWQAPRAFTAASVASWPPGHDRRIRRAFGLYRALRGRPIFLNKSSMINYMVPEILSIFPDARFIHIIRDGRAVAYSYAKKEYGKMCAHEALYRSKGLYTSFDELVLRMADLWKETVQTLRADAVELELSAKGRYTELCYEDFCEEPEQYTRALLDFLGATAPLEDLGEIIESQNHKFQTALAAETLTALERVVSVLNVYSDAPLSAANSVAKALEDRRCGRRDLVRA